MRFEWDERKRITNLEKHGLDFMDAVNVFEAPHVIIPSAQKDEERYLAIGLLQERYVAVIYTIRNKTIRLISFRRARHEERRYYETLYRG